MDWILYGRDFRHERVKGKYAEFIFFPFFFFFFCFLARNENIKRPGFYTLYITRIFSKFPKLKHLN